jgi:hypothetical protein
MPAALLSKKWRVVILSYSLNTYRRRDAIVLHVPTDFGNIFHCLIGFACYSWYPFVPYRIKPP